LSSKIQDRSELTTSPSIGESEKMRGFIIRIVSNDHHESARNVEDQAGILRANQRIDDIIYRSEFREIIVAHKVVVARETQEKSVFYTNFDQFNKIKERFRVLTLASAEDKLILISGINYT
jgi:hypothetical protein